MGSLRVLATTILIVPLFAGCQAEKSDYKKAASLIAKGSPTPEMQPSAIPLPKDTGTQVLNSLSPEESKAKDFLLSKGAVLSISDGHIVSANFRVLGTQPKAIWSCLKGLPALETLDLSGALFKDADLAGLDSVKQLKTLDLSTTVTLTDAGLVHIQNLSNLTTLNLGHTFVRNAGIAQLKSLKQLENLDLTNTLVTSAAIENLKQSLPKLKVSWRRANGSN
jgi:Leucine-rich repeat (LRR) protein